MSAAPKMTLLLYVVRAGQRGNVDVPITDELAIELWREHLAEYAAPFVRAGLAAKVDHVPRLVTHDPDPVAALRALGAELEAAQRWAEIVLRSEVAELAGCATARVGPPSVPPAVTALWDRHPKPVYRELLGPSVAAALEIAARAAAAQDGGVTPKG